jgi:hypothetical protein
MRPSAAHSTSAAVTAAQCSYPARFLTQTTSATTNRLTEIAVHQAAYRTATYTAGATTAAEGPVSRTTASRVGRLRNPRGPTARA